MQGATHEKQVKEDRGRWDLEGNSWCSFLKMRKRERMRHSKIEFKFQEEGRKLWCKNLSLRGIL